MDMDQEKNELPSQVAKDVVVSLEYTLNVDGEVVDFSEKDSPLEYIQGYNQIIPGLETALEGMKVGDNKEVKVLAQDGYGAPDPSAIVEVSRADFPPDIPIEPGTALQVRNLDGEILDARILTVEGDRIQLDFNHPLAGKDLTFNVTIAGLRHATDEEISHGHVHNDYTEEDDYDDEDFDEEGEEFFIDEDDFEDDEDFEDEDDLDDNGQPSR